MIRKRRFPVVGDGGGVWSFVHIADAAEATVAAVENGGRGRLQHRRRRARPGRRMAAGTGSDAGAKKPRRCPRFIGRLAAGPAGVVLMTELRGASNAKAKRELGLAPRSSELATRSRGVRPNLATADASPPAPLAPLDHEAT